MEILTVPVVVAFVAGLLVGWNFLSQPVFVLDIINKIKGFFVKK